MTRLARGDAGDGRGDRGDERGRRSPRGSATSGPSSTRGWPSSSGRRTRRGGDRRAARAPRERAWRAALSDERVFVVPRRRPRRTRGWYGLRTDGLDGVRRGRRARRAATSRATEMERDPSFKQVIPYLVLRDGERYFLMRRTAAGGDARLHDRYSIGVGGHLNPGDGGLLGGLRREWHGGARRRLRARVPARRAAQRRHDRGRRGPPRRRLRGRRRRSSGRDPRDRQARGLVRGPGRGRGGRRPARDVEPLAFEFLEASPRVR